MADPKTDDMWLASREKSARYSGGIITKTRSAFSNFLHPAQSLPLVISTLGIGTNLYCVDLNKYRPDINVEMLIDQGVRVFMLRVGGPTRWVYANWTYEVDSTFVPYYERIRTYAKSKGIAVWIIGYGVHNPWSNEEGNYQGLDPQVTWLKEATRNHHCDLYCWDDEVAECWKDNQNTVITDTNLVKSISICMEQTFREMEAWGPGRPKMAVHYSANWFMKKYAWSKYQAWLDNADVSVDTRHFLTWRAWVPTIFSVPYDLITQIFDLFITPNGIQENAYLRLGSELAADFWQGTFTATGPWCPKKADGTYKYGIDGSVGYGPSSTIAKFIYNANLASTIPDAIPPSAVSNLNGAYAVPDVVLRWDAATDNVGVVKYRIFRDNLQIGESPNLFYTDKNIPAGTYSYKVVALDEAGNIGPEMGTVVLVPENPPGDFVTRAEFINHVHSTGKPQ